MLIVMHADSIDLFVLKRRHPSRWYRVFFRRPDRRQTAVVRIAVPPPPYISHYNKKSDYLDLCCRKKRIAGDLTQSVRTISVFFLFYFYYFLDRAFVRVVCFSETLCLSWLSVSGKVLMRTNPADLCVPIGTASWSCTTDEARAITRARWFRLALRPWWSFCQMFGVVSPRASSGSVSNLTMASSWRGGWRLTRTRTSSLQLMKRHLKYFYF